MGLRQRVEAIDYDVKNSFNNVSDDVDDIYERIDQLNSLHNKLREEFDKLQEELSTNGVATAINKLNAEVFKDRKEPNIGRFTEIMYAMNGVEMGEEPTLAGKVDAILEHLGLDVTVKPEEVKEAKIVAKKRKTTKKGRK